MNYILIIIIIIIIVGVILYYKSKSNAENLVILDGQYCKECNQMSRGMCGTCQNCGYCINESGQGECIPGDDYGPYFRKDCLRWERNIPIYGNYYDTPYRWWDYLYPSYWGSWWGSKPRYSKYRTHHPLGYGNFSGHNIAQKSGWATHKK